jgi:phage shock protein A
VIDPAVVVFAFDAAGYGGLLLGIAAVLGVLIRREARRTRRELQSNGGNSFADEAFGRLERIEVAQNRAEARATMRHRLVDSRFVRLERGHDRLTGRLDAIDTELERVNASKDDAA